MNTHITDSYKVTSREDMREGLLGLRASLPQYYSVHKRTMQSMIHEWCAHNLLYNLHIARSHTKDVDINDSLPWIVKCGYFFLSLFYYEGKLF